MGGGGMGWARGGRGVGVGWAAFGNSTHSTPPVPVPAHAGGSVPDLGCLICRPTLRPACTQVSIK